jgi:UDPglucose 6-dehydrogenase
VIGKALGKKDDYHLVVLKSTVLPGSCEGEIIPALERSSGKVCGPDFGFCYNPEFIALGRVVRDLFHPDFLLIGESDKRAGDELVGAHSLLLGDLPPTPRMHCVNAELAKLALNSFVTMKITFANLIAQLCERLPEGNADAVTRAIGLDPRIGSKYLKGGLGFGGPCFPRDNAAMLCLAQRLDVPFPLAAVTDQANTEITLRIANQIEEAAPPGGRVAVLGLSYKPDTPVVEESQGLLIAKILADRGLDVAVYDPLAMNTAEGVLGASVSYAQSLDDCVEGADVVAITTPWDQFRQLPLEKLNSLGPRIVFDCWGICTSEARDLAQLHVLGMGPHRPVVDSTTNRRG